MALIARIVPGVLFKEWPANAPDLSLMRNFGDGFKQGPCKNVRQLEERLEAIKQSIAPSHVRALVDGILDWSVS